MKHARKLASVLLALLIVFSLAAPAFAAGTGEIILDNPIAGETYTAHKIFDVVYDTTITNYAYSINSANEWFATVKAYADVTENGLTLTATAADPNLYIVETTNDFSAPNFANALKNAAPDMKNGIVLTTSGTGVAATGLDLGYYFVTSTNGALCNLTTTNPTVTIHDKNEVIFIKDVDMHNVELGENPTFTITGNVPDTTGFEKYTYEITDTMSTGLTFNKDVTITVGGVTLTDNFTLTYGNNGFVLKIDVMKLQNDVTDEIVVTYSATVNADAIAVISENNATLEYSNDPTKDTTSKQTDQEKLFSAKIIIDKYDSTDSTKKLADAKFVLYKEDNGVKYYYNRIAATATEPEKVSWHALAANETLADAITAGNITEVTTDANGAANFGGLENGTYKLHETAAPAGYNMLKNDVQVVINGNDTDATTLSITSQIANNTGSQLPETGGMGTTIFYILGATLTLGAAVLLITKKRMAA